MLYYQCHINMPRMLIQQLQYISLLARLYEGSLFFYWDAARGQSRPCQLVVTTLDQN